MLRVEIDIERPLSLALITMGVGGFVVWSHVTAPEAPVMADVNEMQDEIADNVGGVAPQVEIQKSEEEMKRLRIQQQVLERRKEILEHQLRTLEQQQKIMGSHAGPEVEEEFRKSIQLITSLVADQRAAEARMLTALKSMWESEGRSAIATAGETALSPIRLSWPLDPLWGISAGFLDEDYEKTFGFPHPGIDIPALQETVITASADGVVDEVIVSPINDSYNWIRVKHDGFATVYGHVLENYVEEGQTVWEGDPLGISGGMPGTPGAGGYSTGPHMQLELWENGEAIDPLPHLPYVASFNALGKYNR